MKLGLMTLEQKGPQVPPPKLRKWSQVVSDEIQSWDDIIAVTHWTIGDSTRPNGADFYVGKTELGHIHLDGELHMPLTASLRKLLLENNLAEEFPWGDSWIQFQIEDKKTAERAIQLFRLGYDRIDGVPLAELKSRIATF